MRKRRDAAERVTAFIQKALVPDNAQRYPPECFTAPRKTSFKSNLAFRLTIAAYMEQARKCAELRGGEFYVRLWTITAADVLAYKVYLQRWNGFLTAAHRRYPGFSAIRVIEVHPGEDFEIPGQPGRWGCISHGLHIHFVCARFFQHGEMQELAHRAKLGHVSVTGRTGGGKSHTVDSVTNYLSKYLRKGLYENCRGLKGRRMWAPVNFPEAVAVRDILATARWNVVYQRLTVNQDFCDRSFSIRATIAEHGEIVSRLLDKGGYKFLRSSELEKLTYSWIFTPEKLVEILEPSEMGSRYYKEDQDSYSYLPVSLGGAWPGVGKYLEWLNTPEGLHWAHGQKEERKERDRERQRERRRELASCKRLNGSGDTVAAAA